MLSFRQILHPKSDPSRLGSPTFTIAIHIWIATGSVNSGRITSKPLGPTGPTESLSPLRFSAEVTACDGLSISVVTKARSEESGRYRGESGPTTYLSGVNAIAPAYASKLGLRVRRTDVGAQKIDGSTLETFGMVLASFQVEDKLGRAR